MRQRLGPSVRAARGPSGVATQTSPIPVMVPTGIGKQRTAQVRPESTEMRP